MYIYNTISTLTFNTFRLVSSSKPISLRSIYHEVKVAENNWEGGGGELPIHIFPYTKLPLFLIKHIMRIRTSYYVLFHSSLTLFYK